MRQPDIRSSHGQLLKRFNRFVPQLCCNVTLNLCMRSLYYSTECKDHYIVSKITTTLDTAVQHKKYASDLHWGLIIEIDSGQTSEVNSRLTIQQRKPQTAVFIISDKQ